MGSKYSKQYEINYHDVDCNLKCKLSSIVNFFCDVGNCHSESIGDTIEHLTEKNMAWVFYKYDINIYEYPKYRDVVTIETYPIAFNKFYAHRGYNIINKEGKIIAKGMALFFLINIERRRPMRIPKEEIELYEANDINGLHIDMEDVKALEDSEINKIFDVRYSDIDSNGHVNNSKYFEWAIESMPEEIIKDHEIKRIKVCFEKETTYGHKVNVAAQIIKEEDGKIRSLHLITSDNDEKLTKLEIEWE